MLRKSGCGRLQLVSGGVSVDQTRHLYETVSFVGKWAWGCCAQPHTHGVQGLLSKTSGETYSFSFINHSLGSGKIKTIKNAFYLFFYSLCYRVKSKGNKEHFSLK